MGAIFIWVVCAIVVLIGLVIYNLSKKYIMGPVLKDREPTLKTPLSAFREAHGYDNLVGSNRSEQDSISSQYEEMCVLNVLEYENDPRIDAVIKNYNALLKGKIADPKGKHIPSETLNGRLNSNYERYLKSQIRVCEKAGKDVSWMKELLKNYRDKSKEDDYRVEFYLKLSELGSPDYFLESLISGDRMQTYSPEEWKELINKANEYERSYSAGHVIRYLEQVYDKKSVLDEVKMGTFSKLIEMGISDELASAYTCGEVLEDDLEAVSEIMESEDLSCDEALKEHLLRKKTAFKREHLKVSYRQRTA